MSRQRDQLTGKSFYHCDQCHERIEGAWHKNAVRPDMTIGRELARLAAEVDRLKAVGLY